MSIVPMETSFNEIWIKIKQFPFPQNAFQNVVCKMSAIFQASISGFILIDPISWAVLLGPDAPTIPETARDLSTRSLLMHRNGNLCTLVCAKLKMITMRFFRERRKNIFAPSLKNILEPEQQMTHSLLLPWWCKPTVYTESQGFPTESPFFLEQNLQSHRSQVTHIWMYFI